MDEGLEILLTNDDGIDATGLAVLRDELDAIADVTTIAPANDQSKVGRQTSSEVVIEERNGAVAIHGTPADCVIAGLTELCPEPDLVVSGCNRGANLGGYVLGRSGTVSAAVEAAFLGVPAIATSLYVPVDDRAFEDVEVYPEDYREAARATRYLVERALPAGVFEHADYLNVNAPMPAPEGIGEPDGPSPDDLRSGTATERPAPMRVTQPSHHYEVAAERDGTQLRLRDRIWELMAAGELEEPVDTDRGAVLNGEVSVSPLTAPHATETHDSLDELVAEYAATATE